MEVENRLDRMNSTEKVKQLEFIDSRIFQLPYDSMYIENHIIEELLEYCLVKAPNFPGRKSADKDEYSIQATYENWIASYPEEFKLYYWKSYELIRKYSAKNNAK